MFVYTVTKGFYILIQLSYIPKCLRHEHLLTPNQYYIIDFSEISHNMNHIKPPPNISYHETGVHLFSSTLDILINFRFTKYTPKASV